MVNTSAPPEVQLELLILKDGGFAELVSKAEAARIAGMKKVSLRTTTFLALALLAAETLEKGND